MTSADPHRLPSNVRPVHYSIELTPYLGAFTFTGRESVTVRVNEPTSVLLVNAAELTISAASATLSDGTAVTAHASVNEEAERATIALDRELPPGDATLHFEVELVEVK